MAASIVTGQARSAEGNSNAPTTSFVSNVTAGNTILVAIAYFKTASGDFTGISGNSNTYTQISTEQADTNGGRLRAYYVKNCNGGATTVTGATSAAHSWGIAIEEWQGLDTTAPLDGTPAGTNGSSNAPNGGNVTTSAADGIVWGACSQSGAAATIGEGTNFTLGTENESVTDMPIHTENRGAGGGLAAGTYGAPHTFSASRVWTAISAAFKATASAAMLPKPYIVQNALFRSINY